MPINFNIPKFPFNIPWFLYDINNFQLITSTLIPSDIKDIKKPIITETPIPGRNFQPIMPGGNGNRKISFTIPIIKRNNTVGNTLVLKQFELLRNQSTGFIGIFAKQFTPNPKVLFYWGVGTVPLIYYVSKCDFTHVSNMVNEMGNPQRTDVEIELILDETHPLYKGEEVFRKITAITGKGINAYEVIRSQITGDKTI